MNLKNLLLISVTILVVALIFEIFLFLSGSKILTEELEVLPGEYLEADKFAQIFGNQIDIDDPVLLCEYFNGRKFVYIVPGTIFVAGTSMAFSCIIHIW